jgi:hypothetical protein
LSYFFFAGAGFLPAVSAAQESPDSPSLLSSGVFESAGDRGDSSLGIQDLSFQVQSSSLSTSADSDFDGLTDDVESSGWWNAEGFFATDPFDPDSDDDGLFDGKEKLILMKRPRGFDDEQGT